MKYGIGIDLGGTKIECAVIGSDHSILHRERGPTQAHLGRSAVLTNIRRQYVRALGVIKDSPYGVVLGTPGSVNSNTGLLRNSSLEFMNGRNLQVDVEGWLNHPVIIANDAQCFALAESQLGAGKGYHRVFGAIFGTGVGGALVESGTVVTGRNGILGEWGHTTLDSTQRNRCRCGRHGCVESILGGGSIQRMYTPGYNEIAPGADVILARDHRALFDWYRNYGLAMANLIQVLDPDCIVLGGGLSNLPDIMTTGDSMIRERLFSDTFETVITRASLGDSAGSIGAALLALDQV